MTQTHSNGRIEHGAAPRRRIVAVLAHPDDETFIIGGTLALYASHGHDVHVLYGPFGPQPDGSPDPQRRDELRRAAQTLGITANTFLPKPSSPGGSPAPGHEDMLPHLASTVGSELRSLQPDVVITFDATGATGNLDHILIGAATLQAVGAMPEIAAPRLYAAVFGRRPLMAGLRIRRIVRRKDRDNLRDAVRIARESQRPTTTVDVRGVLERRREAAGCYTTALREGAWWMRRWELLPPRVRRLFAPREVYARLIPPVREGETPEQGLFGEQ